MILIAVVLTGWVLLSLPAAVLMGRCIRHGLDPRGVLAAAETEAPWVPQQRPASESTRLPEQVRV